MTLPSEPALTISLFELLRQHLGTSLPLVRCSKATLVHLSHTLEDQVLRNRLPAMLFTGFQESSHWREETERYRALAEVAQQVCVFAGGQLPPESSASQLHVTLKGDDPLRQEWFVLILCSEFSALLCGQDRHEPAPDEAMRLFDTFWSLDPAVVALALDQLEQVIAHYRPERLAALQAARQTFGLQPPSAAMLSQFSAEMIRYNEGLQQSLQLSNSELLEQLRWRESLTQTLVHDLRTPLQGLIMALDILDHGADYGIETVSDTLRIAMRTAADLDQLVQMLLDTNQLEAGQLVLQWQPINLRQLIDLAAESLQPLLTAQGIALDVTIAANARLIWGDQPLLRRVLQNLLGNALKFTSSGGRIGIESEAGTSVGMLDLRVRDTGSGIAANVLPKIFERNVQGRLNDRRGSGLGLYFCRLAIEAHGGTIRADSQPGRGTIITMRLPTKPRLI